jgi:hypothetical protein
MNRIIKWSVFFVILVACIAAYSYYSRVNSDLYKREGMTDFYVKHYAERYETGYSMFLSNVANFPWYYAYVFKPGTTRKEIEFILGYKDKNIPRVIKEGYTQMLFDFRGDVSCSIHSIKDYVFDVGEFEGDYLRIDLNDKPRCTFVKEGAIIRVIIDVVTVQ